MRVSAPDVTLEPERLVVTAVFESGAGRFDPVAVRLAAPRSIAGRIDVSATPFLPIAAVAAAACGEDLEIGGWSSAAAVGGAGEASALMAGWWADDGWKAPAIKPRFVAAAAPAGGRGHGLFFSLGVDSWASLMALRAEPEPERVTHLLTVLGTELPRGAAAEAEILDTMHLVAEASNLPLIELETNARDLLDVVGPWERTHGSVMAAFGLLLGPLLNRVTIASSHSDVDRPHWGSHIELDHLWSSESTAVVHHLGHVTRTEKTAIVATDQLALDTLLVCWESGEAHNCGRCAKCLRTMTALDLVGALGRGRAFPDRIDPALVRNTAAPDSAVYVRELIAQLPAGELRDAWQSHLPAGFGTRRVVAPPSHAMAGPSLLSRVRHGLAGTGWQAEQASAGSHDTEETADELVVGWERGMVPLRPAAATTRDVLAAIAGHRSRAVAWMVADMADPDRVNDHWAAAVADAAERAWGPGICYLGGIGWARDAAPALGTEEVGWLLDRVRCRLWWSAAGTLDPIRVVESIEHGCLPLQVMGLLEAGRLRRRLPSELAPLVVAVDGLAEVDVSPSTTAAQLQRAAEVVLAGAVERDLAWDAAFRPQRGLASVDG